MTTIENKEWTYERKEASICKIVQAIMDDGPQNWDMVESAIYEYLFTFNTQELTITEQDYGIDSEEESEDSDDDECQCCEESEGETKWKSY